MLNLTLSILFPSFSISLSLLFYTVPPLSLCQLLFPLLSVYNIGRLTHAVFPSELRY